MVSITKKLISVAALLGLWAFALPLAPSFGAPSIRDDEDEEEEEEDKWFAVVGGDVFTGTGAVLRGATVLSKNGKIEKIGHDLFIPEDAEILKARGMRVYPGLVALNATTRISKGFLGAEEGDEDDGVNLDTHSGIDDLHPDNWWGREDAGASSSLGDQHLDPDGHGEEGFEEATEAELDNLNIGAADEYDPFSQYLVLALATGITTAEQSNAAIKLKRGEIDGIAMSEKTRSTFSFTTRNPSSIRSLKEKFARASEYLREHRAWEKIKDKDEKKDKEPSKKGVDTSALRVLRGELMASFSSNEREDILGIARLAQQYGFRPVIAGCREGWTVADELGRAGAYAIVTPRSRQAKDERLVRPGGSSIENAAILHAHGVQVAITPASTSFDLGGITGRDLMHLPVEAGFAVRGGLSEAAALASITTVPARLLGVGHRVGTLEVGKDCDLIVTDGDLLHYQTFVQYAVVAGKLAYDKQKEIFFAHIRPRPEEPEEEPEEVEEVIEESDAGDEEGDPDEEAGEEEEEEGDEEGEDGDEEDGDEEDGDEEDGDEEDGDEEDGDEEDGNGEEGEEDDR